MTILDYIFFGALILGIIIGAWKGLLKQIFAIIGIFVIALGTVYISPRVDAMLISAIEADGTRSLVAMGITAVALAVVYGLATMLISKIINKTPVLGKVNRLLGALFAVAVVYLVTAVIVALLVGTADDFLAKIKDMLAEPLQTSWVVNNIYGGYENPQRNFFGNWLLKLLQEKLQTVIPDVPTY